MRQCEIVLLFVSLIGLSLWEAAGASPVTNEEIRGTIQSLIYSYNQLDNKLERHEHRERALGELMKKAMQSVQKGQKNLEPLSGIFARLDDRVSQIETNLMTQEDKYNTQSEKFHQDVEHMFKWMRENDECFKHPPGANAVAAPAATAVPNEFMQQQQEINKQLLNEMKALSANVAKLLDNSKQVAEQTKQGFDRMPNASELLAQIEAKLEEHADAAAAAAVTTAAPTTSHNREFEAKLMEGLETLSTNVAALGKAPQPALVLNEKDRAYLQELANETLNALAVFKSETAATQETALANVTERLKQVETKMQANLKELSGDVQSSFELLNTFYGEVNESYTKLNDGFDALGNFNNIMMTSSDVVLDTQRKVEFGTLQVVQKLSILIEQQMTDLTSLLRARFNDVDESIVNTQIEANRNISGLLDTALTQVWHRIEIMNGEISDSAELLRLMQAGHDGYINSTFSTMLSMSAKVEDTKTRMIDMDSNLNFLIGKLSLMSSEFGNIKKGLAESLEDLRNAFQSLHKLLPTGSGPLNIEKSQYLTPDVNLLAKRHA